MSGIHAEPAGHGLELARCAAPEAAPLGVRINAVAPSLVMHGNLAGVISVEPLADRCERGKWRT